jgi:hypothetical protein
MAPFRKTDGTDRRRTRGKISGNPDVSRFGPGAGRPKSPMRDICEIFGAPRLSNFSTQLAQSGHSSAASGARALRDRNDLKLLTGRADFIPNSFAHQEPCDRGYEGNRTGLGVRFVLSHDMIFLHAPIVASEGHRALKGYSVGRRS